MYILRLIHKEIPWPRYIAYSKAIGLKTVGDTDKAYQFSNSPEDAALYMSVVNALDDTKDIIVKESCCDMGELVEELHNLL